MDFAKLDARGKIIKIPKEIVFKSSVLKTYFEKWNSDDKPYYLNYDKKIVHKLCDYLSGNNISNVTKLQKIADELIIDINFRDQPDRKFMSNDVIQGMIRFYMGKFNDFKKDMSAYNIVFDKYNFSTFLSMMSYYEGYHVEIVYDLLLDYTKVPSKSKWEDIEHPLNLDKLTNKYGIFVISHKNDYLIDITDKLNEIVSTSGILFSTDKTYFKTILVNDKLKIYACAYIFNISYNGASIRFSDYDVDIFPFSHTYSEEFKEKVKEYLSKNIFGYTFINKIITQNISTSNISNIFNGKLVYHNSTNTSTCPKMKIDNYKHILRSEKHVHLTQ